MTRAIARDYASGGSVLVRTLPISRQIRHVELNPWRDDLRVARDTPQNRAGQHYECNRLVSSISMRFSLGWVRRVGVDDAISDYGDDRLGLCRCPSGADAR